MNECKNCVSLRAELEQEKRADVEIQEIVRKYEDENTRLRERLEKAERLLEQAEPLTHGTGLVGVGFRLALAEWRKG